MQPTAIRRSSEHVQLGKLENPCHHTLGALCWWRLSGRMDGKRRLRL